MNALVLLVLPAGLVLAAVLLSRRVFGWRHPYMDLAGAFAVAALTVAFIILLGETGDHFDAACMQGNCDTSSQSAQH